MDSASLAERLFRGATRLAAGPLAVVQDLNNVKLSDKFMAGLISNTKAVKVFPMNVQTIMPSSNRQQPPINIAFDRSELSIIMGLYGRMVAAGEWRDYAMSFLLERAIFAIYRRAAENPLYRIEKHPKLRRKQGQYCVIGLDGQILKRGHDLKNVLRVLERKLIRLVD